VALSNPLRVATPPEIAYDPCMDRRAAIAIVRIGFALLTLVAIATQLGDLAIRGALNPINFFSYFTIQSNIIGIAAFVTAAASWRRGGGTSIDMLRGAATVYLTVTFVVFSLLLSGTDVDTAIPWVNTVLHGVFPVVVILDWILMPPLTPIAFRDSLLWLAYPILWVAYTMLRGPAAGWYPYPFLNPDNGGYGTVVLYIGAIFVFGAVLCAVVSAVSRWRRPQLPADLAAPSAD
jgi:hypothetical protein